MVVATWPDTFAVIEPTRDPVKIRFNERISERPTRGSLDEAVVVSPVTGPVRVKHTRGGLEISVTGGFQAGLVYRVRVLPVIKDMFGNPMDGPFELVFSTGGVFEENVIAGVATDRITAEPVEGVRVEARPAEAGGEERDGPRRYLAVTDTAGIFVLRYLPADTYEVVLFEDVNRNGTADFRELQGRTAERVVLSAEAADTVVERVALLRPDTTPAEVIRAEAVDSTLLRIGFDDYLDPDTALERLQVTLTREGGTAPRVARLLWEREVDSMRAVADSIRAEELRRARADSLQGVADSLGAVLDSLRVAGDTIRADSVQGALERILARLEPTEAPEPPRRGEREPPAARPEPLLPQQAVYALLDGPLAPGELYQVVVSAAVNVNGVGGGGGEAGVTWTPPEPPPGTAPDTGRAVPPDTGQAAAGRLPLHSVFWAPAPAGSAAFRRLPGRALHSGR